MAQRKRPEDLRSHQSFGVKDLRAFSHRSRALQMGYTRRGFRRQAGDRDHQHVERSQSVPRALQAARRGSEARRVAGGRFPVELPAHSVSETVREAELDDVPQLPRDGGRGVAALASGGRRGADGRLRQDHAGLAHGRDQHGAADDLHAGGADAARQLARRAARFRQRHLEILGRAARGNDHRERLAGSRGRHRALVRPLHDDGHGLDDDFGRRNARAHAAGRGVDPRGRCKPSAHGENSGRRIVEMVWEDLKPSDILTRKSFDNAITAIHALSGSTNAIIHLTAIAGRAGHRASARPLRRDRAHDAGARERAAGRRRST